MAKRKAVRAAAPAPRRRFPEWAVPAAALATLAIAIFGNSIANGFVGDDKFQLLKNPLVTSFSSLPRIFGASVWSFLGVRGNYYRPLQFVIYLLLYQCAGFHAAVFHLFMVLLHALNTVLLYFLVRRLSEGRIALAAAALFAVHPVHTEAIDWIAALPDVMLTTLMLAAVLWFARQEGAPGGLRVLAHCGIYLLALFTKETGVMLVALYAGFGFLWLGRGWSEFRVNWRLYTGLAATLGIYLALRVEALGSLAPGQQSFFHLSAAGFALSAVVTAAGYLGMLLFAAPLNYFHVFHPTLGITPGFLLSAAVLGLVAFCFFRSRQPLVTYGIFWAAVCLAPTLNLTGVGENVFTERYLYLPSAGFCWIAGWAWNLLARRRPQWAVAAAAVILLACSAEAVARNRDWRDDYTLLQITLRQSPDSGWVQDTVAGLYVERGAFSQALEHERLAVQLQPGRAIFRRKLGYLLLPNDPQAASVEFQKALQLEPGVAQGHCDLALAYETAGEPRRAAAEYARALQLDPRLREAREGYERLTKAAR